MRRAVLFLIIFLTIFGVSTSQVAALSAGDPCPDGKVQGNIICDPSQSPRTRFVCSRGNPSVLVAQPDCVAPQICSGVTGGCVDPAPSGPTGPLQAGQACPSGYISGSYLCDSTQSPTTRFQCSIGANPVLVQANCTGSQTCSNGLCVSPTAPPVTGQPQEGTDCPTGYTRGQSFCSSSEGATARYTCTRDLKIQKAFCASTQTCSNGNCVGPADAVPAAASGEEINRDLCNQALDKKATCESCLSNKGLWTAVGCIPFGTPTATVRVLLTIGLGIAGSAVLLMILAAGFLFTISRNEPKQVEEAKSLITSAVTGILFIIFSVTILRFIGVNILQLPAFG